MYGVAETKFAVYPWFWFCVFVLSLCVLILILAPCLGKLELVGPLPTSSESPPRVELFKNDKCREAYDTLNCRHKIWSEIRPLGPILSLEVGCLS